MTLLRFYNLHFVLLHLFITAVADIASGFEGRHREGVRRSREHSDMVDQLSWRLNLGEIILGVEDLESQ